MGGGGNPYVLLRPRTLGLIENGARFAVQRETSEM